MRRLGRWRRRSTSPPKTVCASGATGTVAGAFEALTSRLTVYIGQSAQVSGATQAIAGAMQLLADNLETIIPLLAIIGVAGFGRFPSLHSMMTI